jgi:hypothetical protein
VLHAYPRSACSRLGFETASTQALLHTEPIDPPSSSAGSTQHTSPLGQSLALVQATQIGPQHSEGLAAVHVFDCGQQTWGGVHAVVVQSCVALPLLLVSPLLPPVVPVLPPPVVAPLAPPDEALDATSFPPEKARSTPVRLPHPTSATKAAAR